MLRVFAGYDEREEVGSWVFASSLMEKASVPVSLCNLKKETISAALKEGTNAFTVSRFLVPWLCRYRGWAVFMDGADMLLNGDIADLLKYEDPTKAVLVVKHDYQTKHPYKYIGTKMEAENRDYERKQWASMMLINCEHIRWRQVTPTYCETTRVLDLLQLRFIPDDLIGSLPKEWNWLADEDGVNPDAKVLHWTAGVPGFPLYKHAPHSAMWFRQLERVNHADF